MAERRFMHLLRTATPFTKSGEVDEDALREYLERFVAAEAGILVASTGSGEGGTLSWEELRRVYRIAVEACAGRIPVYSNQPEQFTAELSLAHAQLAVECGVHAVNLYGPDGRHGYRPTDAEYTAYFDYILGVVRHPVTLCPNPVINYRPEPGVIADICNRHSQIIGVLLSGMGGDEASRYFLDLQRALGREVKIYVQPFGSITMLTLGAAGVMDGAGNFIPKTYRLYLDLVEAGDVAAASEVYADIRKVEAFVSMPPFHGARYIKPMMRAFTLPGSAGGVRPPYIMPSEAEIARFRDGALTLNVPEINELARAAGAAWSA
jgi:dihydrodipicolinate synthase/N-acetylneuraminate lyase